MDLRDIELIEAVNRTGSRSKACIELSISQPTFSKRLARLERTLRTELFFRYSSGLIATSVADYVLAKSHQTSSQLRDIKRHVELITSLDLGELRLCVGPIVEQLTLPQALSRFMGTTGDVSVSIVVEDDQLLLKLFAAAELDIIVGKFSTSEQSTDHVRGFKMVSDNIFCRGPCRRSTVLCRNYGSDLHSIPVNFAQGSGEGPWAKYPSPF